MAGPTRRWPTSWRPGWTRGSRPTTSRSGFRPASGRASSARPWTACEERTRGGLGAPGGERAVEGLKFAECLPPDLAARMVRARLADADGVAGVLGRATRTVAAV